MTTKISRITVVLYAHNEALFIADAIDSLLRQDYPSLEVVFSDDGSDDGTFEIMQEAAEKYCGEHQIILSRNIRNCGIGYQINAAVAMTSGDLIILANGDDISHPNRVSRIVEMWESGGRAAKALWSSINLIDQDGLALGQVKETRVGLDSLEGAVRSRFGGVAAASLAFHRSAFEEFGPLPANLILEDNPILARAVLLGPVIYIEEPLVDYRVHCGNISQAYAVEEFGQWRQRHRSKALWQRRESVKAYLQILRDLHQRPADSWEPIDLARARWVGIEKLVENALLKDYYGEDRSVSDTMKWRSLLRLAWCLAKTRVKRLIPWIEYRNDRWHYRSVIDAAKGKN